MTALPVPAAAAALGVPVGRLRRWIATGCPVEQRGGRGRGRAALVDPGAVRAWHEAGRVDAVRLELAAVVPHVVAAATLTALANASPLTQGGAELARLRVALGDSARITTAALLTLLEKSKSAD